MKKYSACSNTVFNREMTKYVEMLIEADMAHTDLEASFDTYVPGGDNRDILRVSQKLDDLVIKIMEKRVVIDQILDARNTFS